MKQNWKQRFKSLIQKRRQLLANGVFLFVLLPCFYMFFIQLTGAALLETVIGTLPQALFLCLLFNINISDEEKQENKEEANPNQNIPEEKNHLQALYEKVEFSSHIVDVQVKSLVCIIERVQEECNVLEEEIEYLTMTLPKQLIDMLEVFKKIDYKYRKEMQKEILAFLEEKRKKCNETYIETHQHQLVSVCKGMLQQAKEQKREYIKVTTEE